MEVIHLGWKCPQKNLAEVHKWLGTVRACVASLQKGATPDKRRFLNFVSFAEPAFTVSQRMACNPITASERHDGSHIFWLPSFSSLR